MFLSSDYGDQKSGDTAWISSTNQEVEESHNRNEDPVPYSKMVKSQMMDDIKISCIIGKRNQT